MDLPMRTSIDEGLLIAHSVGIVCNEAARLGRNVTIFHGVTLGGAASIAADGTRGTMMAPVIEDDVWIGPNATIVGGVRIGRGSRILANTMVTRDIPARSMVAGNPAQIVRENCAPDVSNAVSAPA